MTSTTLYGLALDADFELHDAAEPSDSPSDVTVRTGLPIEQWAAQPEGETLLHFETDEPWYTLVRDATGRLHFRVHSVCDYLISSDLTEIELRMHSASRPGMDGIMTTGTLLSLLLYLRGCPVLHGSAVDVEGSAIAFVGHSGQGKTTMATLLCTEGARAVTDDVLVVDDSDGFPVVRRGSRELRLRTGTDELIAQISNTRFRLSADERRVIAPTHSAAEHLPLRAIVIPRPTRDGSPLRFERLAGKAAAFALLSYPRLMGWRAPEVLTRTFERASSLATQVPVLIGHIPWGPPFPTGVTSALLAEADA